MSIRKGLFYSLSESYFTIAIQLASAMILARLLTPEEIGIYAVSLAIIGIAQVLRDFGIGSFLIQERELKDSHISTAFGFSLAIGISLFSVVYLTAPWLAAFYEEPRLLETIHISAINFLVLPFCTISVALLRRNMAFKRLAAVNVIAAFTGFVVGTTLAYHGFGPNSMAVAAVAANLVTGTLAWLARQDRRLILPGFVEWRVILSFGGQSSAANIVTTISMDINDLALGKILGFEPVALISRAQGVMNLFHRDLMSAVRNVAYPAFAKAHRDGEPVDEKYVASVTSVTAFAWPFYGFVSIYAYELIRLMFGPQWDEAAELVPIFCLAGAFAAVVNLLLPAIMAVGRIDLFTKAELTIQPLRAIVIVGAALIFESLIACAIAFLFIFVISVPYLYTVKDKCIKTDYRKLGDSLLSSFKVSASCLVMPFVFHLYIPEQNSMLGYFFVLSGAGLLALTGWTLAIVYFNHPIKDEELFQRFINLLPKKPKQDF